MYLLFVDESGTHGGSHAFVLGGLAIHEQDAPNLQRRLNAIVKSYVRSYGPEDDFELHASELRNAKKPPNGSRKGQKPSVWANVPRSDRLRLLEAAYKAIADFAVSDPELPTALFGVVLDQSFRSHESAFARERFAYEVLLNKFDVMLKRHRKLTERYNLGLVVHDRRIVAERDIQEWTREWQNAAGKIGKIRNLADVPLFADSRATRLIQVADLISYAVWRHYMPNLNSEDYMESLWNSFDQKEGVMHGIVHYTPSYGSGVCTCRPCHERLLAEATAAQGISSGR